MTDLEKIERWLGGKVVEIIPEPNISIEELMRNVLFDLEIIEKQTVGIGFLKKSERFIDLGVIKVVDNRGGKLEHYVINYLPEREDLQ